MERKYKNPPVMEVVCEFRFSPDVEWDITIPGLLYERLKKDFPHKEQRIIQNIQINQKREKIEQNIHSEERIIFFDLPKKSLVQIGSRILSVNRLKPYQGWESFKPAIEKSFKTLSDIISIKKLQRIGLRYINKIDIPESSIDLETYFDFRPFLGNTLPRDIINFNMNCIFPFNNGEDLCKIELKTATPASSDYTSFILDLDYFLVQSKEMDTDKTMKWVENAHNELENIFEGCIKEPLRLIFDKE